jgi:hypothetical protein
VIKPGAGDGALGLDLLQAPRSSLVCDLDHEQLIEPAGRVRKAGHR